MAEELENLIVKVDSELGDLKGLDSAITALERLSKFTANATGNIRQLKSLGSAIHSFDNLKLDGLNNATQGIHGMITALQRLTGVTGSAFKAIGQLGRLGDTLNKSFSGIGKNLEGIDKVSIGVLNLVGALDRLTQISGNANGASKQLGNLGRQMQSFNDLNLREIADNIADPLEKIMKAIGNLGNNNKISIRVDKDGIANINQIRKNTKRALSSWQEFENSLNHDLTNLNLGSLFDISQPVEVLERNLKIAQNSLKTFENNARSSLEKVNSALSNFSKSDLENNLPFRNAYRASQMSEAFAKAYKDGIIQLELAIEKANKDAINSAWKHTQDSILNDIKAFNLGDLIKTDLPIEQMRANLRQLQNELSRSQNEMQRAYKNLQRLRSSNKDTESLHANVGYRESYYTWRVNEQYVNKYRTAIVKLNAEISKQEKIPTNDAELQAQIASLMEQQRRYQEMADKLSSQPVLTDEQQRELGIYESGLEIIRGRIVSIQNALEDMQQTDEGVLELMRQTADQAERMAKATAQASQELRSSVGNGFMQFGGVLQGSKNGILGSVGNLTTLFGKEVENGTAKLSTETLEGLKEISSTLGTVTTALGQIGAVAGVIISVFKTFASIVNKIRTSLTQFTQSLIQFAQNMLSKVVGAFNAVAGAVGKAVSAVKSGSELIVSALRKVGDAGLRIMQIFGKIGSSIGVIAKGFMAIGNLITPKTVKKLANANLSIKNIIKNSKILTKVLGTVTGLFKRLISQLTRRIISSFIRGMKQAFEDLAVYEREAADEMLRFNTNVSKIFSALRRGANQWIAAFEPLINAITPAVLNFLDSVQAMGENVAKFMAILTGQPYYIRAKKFYEDYGKNVDKTSKKVKNLTNSLDELNILNDNNDDDDISPEDMFEKVPVDGSLKLPEIAFQDILDKLKDFLRNIPWDKIYAAIRDFIHRLMTLINQALKDLDLWKLLGETLAKLFNALMVAWNQFIIDFDPKATEKALSTLIVNALNNIDWGLIHQNIELTAKKFAQFWNEVFADQALWDSITRTVTNALNEIVHFFDTWAATFDFKQFAQQLTDSITKVLNGFDWSQLKSAVDGWVGGLVNVINTAAANKKFWEAIGDTIAHMLNDVLIEGLNKAGNINFTDLTEALKTAITRALNIDWDSFNEALTKWADGIANVINGIFADPEFLGNVTTNIANFANAITNGLDELVKKLQGYDIGASIAEALTKGFQAIDWNAIIALPLDLLNQFTQALQGFADTVNGFDIGTDFADKITNFLNAIDWAGIQQALSDFGDDITGFINALIAADDLWKKLGETAGNLFNTAITIPLKLIWDIDYDDLGTRIAEAINKAIETANISEAISSIGKAFQNIVDFLSSFVVKLDWSGLGTEIGKGIADAIRNIDAQKLRKLIFDAFSGLSDLLGSALKVMLENGTFYELGEIVGNFLLGVILGLSKLLYENRGKLSQAMKQFADGLANFLDYYHDYIVNALNSIIESIGILIRSFFDNKGKIMNELYEIIGDLNLGDILGDILFMLIRKFISNIKLSSAMIAAVVKSIGGIFKGIFDAIKPYLLYLLQALLAALGSFLAGLALGKAGSFAGGALGGLIGSIFGPVGTVLGKKIGSAIGEKLFKAIGAALGAFGGFNLGDWLKDLFNGESLLDKAKKGWDSFWDKMPWNKNKKVTPKVEVEPQIDVKDTKMPDFSDYLKDSSGKLDLSDYDFKLPDNLTGGGSISYDTLNVNTIYANVLKVGEIIGGKLTISGIDGLDENLYDKLNKNQRDKSLDDTMLGKIGVQNPQDFYDQIAKSLSSLKKNGTSDSDLSSLIDYLNQAKLGSVTGLDGLMDMSMFMNGQFTTDGLIEGLKDKYPELEEAGSGLYVTVHDAYRKEARIHSPSEAMYENGQLTGEGLYNGIKEWIEPLKDLMRELVDELLAALQELVDKVDDILKKLEALGGKQMAEDIGKLTDELDNILEKLEKINKEIKEIPKLIQKNMKKAEQEFKKYIDRMIKDFEKLKDAMEKFFKDLPKKVKDALDECYRAFEEWAKKIRELFDGLTDAFDEFVKHIADTDLSGLQDWSDIFDGLAEAADEELSRTNDELKFWLDLMKKEIEDFNLFALTMWDGLLLETRNAFYLVWLEVEGWLNKLRKLIEDFKRDLKGIWDGLAAEADREMAKVYDVVREWLEKIRDLIKNASTNMFAGLSEAIKRELDKAYQYVCQWVEDVKKKLDEAFAYLNSLLDGGLHITASVNANADALNANTEALRENTTALWANTSALNALTDAIKALQNKLGTIKCECNCGCNCGNCAMGGGGNGSGNGGSGSKQNEPNYADNSGNGTGGTINNPDNSSNNNGTSTPQHNGSNDSWNNDGNKGGAYDPPDSGKNGSGKGGSPSSSDSGNNNGDKGGSPSASSSGSNDGNKDNSSGNSSSDKPKVLPSVKEALEKGLDGMVETNSGNKDSNNGSGNNNDSGNKDNSSSNNGDNNGKTNDPSKFGRAVFDANTGLTTEYDAQGNVIGTHQAAGQWGDKVYDESWTGSMKDRHDAQYVNHARSEFDTKTGILRVYDENGNVVSEEQKDGVWNGIKYKDGKPVDEKDDLGEYITMFARTPGKNYTEGNSLYEWNRLSPSNLDPAINSKYSQLNNPFDIDSTMFYFKTKDGTFIKDSETLAKIRNFIISEYGITDKYKPETNDNNTQTKEATEPKVDQNYLSKVKSAIDSRDASKRARGNAGSGSFALNKYSQQGADLVHKIANGTEQLTSFFMEGVSRNTNLATQKEAFDYWYKNSFLVKGYQMGGVPNSGEIYVARENGSNEFIGSFGNRSVVANNDQIVTAVANGVSMANDSLRNAIDNQTQRLESAINSKELEVSIGDRQIAEANKRGQKSMGQTFVD